MRSPVAFGLTLTLVVSFVAPPPEAGAQSAASACEAAPTVACVLELARAAARTPPDLLSLNSIGEYYLYQMGDKTAAADVAREMVVDAQEKAARAEPPIDPKKPGPAYKRSERPHLAYRRVSGLIHAAMLYGQAGDLAAAKAILDRTRAAGNALDPAARARVLDGIPAALAMQGLALGARHRRSQSPGPAVELRPAAWLRRL